MRVGRRHRYGICPATGGEDEQGFGREAEKSSYEKAGVFVHSLRPGEMFRDDAFNDATSIVGEVFDEMARSGGSNNVVAEFVNLLDTNGVDIDQASFADFDYNEMEGGVIDGEDEVKEVDEGAYQQAQAKKREIEELHNLGRSNLDQGLECGVYGCLHGYVSNLQEILAKNRSYWAACLEQVRNAPPSGTVESEYDKIAQQRYKEMETSQSIFFKLEHCLDMLKDYDKWKLIDKESPLKRGSFMNMDEDEDDDGSRNLNKPDDDKKTKETIKREHEASSLPDKIDAMVQSNELMLAKTLETNKELAEKKARQKQERWQLLKDEGLRKAAIKEKRACAAENKAISKLLAEENRIMTLNRNDMKDISKQ
ncbi:Lactation elevated protein 1 [Hordeum vulgare]|nr:Lactation elevated protein 1 [Hordeum vulgare]